MFHVVLYEPEIPPNTGNIIRLCANSGAQLHLIKPLGFELSDAKLKRAGLDYHDYANLQIHQSLTSFCDNIQPKTLYACSTKGKKVYSQVSFNAGDALLFGPESRGLPITVLDSLPQDQIITIPMQPNSRSLNLSNAVAIILYEAWRQHNFQ